MNNLKLEVADEIAVLTISRPAALNALNSETCLLYTSTSPAVWVAVLKFWCIK